MFFTVLQDGYVRLWDTDFWRPTKRPESWRVGAISCLSFWHVNVRWLLLKKTASFQSAASFHLHVRCAFRKMIQLCETWCFFWGDLQHLIVTCRRRRSIWQDVKDLWSDHVGHHCHISKPCTNQRLYTVTPKRYLIQMHWRLSGEFHVYHCLSISLIAEEPWVFSITTQGIATVTASLGPQELIWSGFLWGESLWTMVNHSNYVNKCK